MQAVLFPYKKIIVIFSTLLVLSGCTSIEEVKDITANKQAYMARKFSPASLSSNIAKQIPTSPSGENKYKELTVLLDVFTEEPTGKTERFQQKITYYPTSTGLVQRFIESSSNGIAYGIFYALTYQGFIELRWQNVMLKNRTSSHLFEVKEIARIDSFPSAPDFTATYSSGIDIQIANFSNWNTSCKKGAFQDASKLSSQLTGKAFEVNCEQSFNNSVTDKEKLIWLEDYGIAFSTENVSSNKKLIRSIKSITIN